MAKLERSKGIFELLRIFAAIRNVRPTARLLVIGTFERASEEVLFRRLCDELHLNDAVTTPGWVIGERKYQLLKSTSVFLYPSVSGDTFSISLLEALACGLPAVCFDVPFSRLVYTTPAIRRVPFGGRQAFADAALALLQRASEMGPEHAAMTFARRYSSWSSVAEAEWRAYNTILGREVAVDTKERRPARS
jgi:glycosyltransferase involved in cell wall biosynthesis